MAALVVDRLEAWEVHAPPEALHAILPFLVPVLSPFLGPLPQVLGSAEGGSGGVVVGPGSDAEAAAGLGDLASAQRAQEQQGDGVASEGGPGRGAEEEMPTERKRPGVPYQV